jgi:hypothetical protein
MSGLGVVVQQHGFFTALAQRVNNERAVF